MFDPNKFLQDVVSKKAETIRGYFAEGAVICWHDSNEQFTLDEFIKANCEYPSIWRCEIERIEKFEKGFVVAAQMDHPQDGFYVKYVSFIELNSDEKVQRLDEYFVAIEEIPQWRRDMNVGRSIK